MINEELDNIKTEVFLDNIRESLKPKVTNHVVKKRQVQKDKPRTANDNIVNAMLQIPELLKVMNKIQKNKQSTNDALRIFSGQELQLKKLLIKSDSHYNKMCEISDSIDTRLKKLDMIELKHARLLTSVEGVLSKLDKALGEI